MWNTVNKVRESDQGGGEANSRTIQSGDKNLRVGIEGIGDVKIVCYEVSEPVTVRIFAGWQ